MKRTDRARFIEKKEETTLIGGLSGRRVGPRRRSGQLGLCGLEALGAESFHVTSSSRGPSSIHAQLCDILPHAQAAMHLRRGQSSPCLLEDRAGYKFSVEEEELPYVRGERNLSLLSWRRQ